MGTLVGLAAFVSVALALLGVAWLFAPASNPLGARLQDLHTNDAPGPEVPARAPRPGRLRAILERLGSSLAPAERDPETEALMRAAGYSGARGVRGFLALKFALMIILPAAVAGGGLVTGNLRSPYVILGVFLLAPTGLFLPNFIYGARARARRDSMRRTLPDVLDLMVICVESGMSLNAAFKRVAEKVRPAAPALAAEFMQLHLEIQAGRSREDALRAMGARTGVDEIRSLTAMMIQSDRLGTSIAKALRVHSDSVRQKFHFEAESRAARATVKLSFPLVLCIFPALLVVIAGPAVLKLVSAFEVMK